MVCIPRDQDGSNVPTQLFDLCAVMKVKRQASRSANEHRMRLDFPRSLINRDRGAGMISVHSHDSGRRCDHERWRICELGPSRFRRSWSRRIGHDSGGTLLCQQADTTSHGRRRDRASHTSNKCFRPHRLLTTTLKASWHVNLPTHSLVDIR